MTLEETARKLLNTTKTVEVKEDEKVGEVKPLLQSNVVSREKLREMQKQVLQDISNTLEKTYGPIGSDTWIITGSDKKSLSTQFSKDGRTVLKKVLYTDPIAMAIQQEIEDVALYTDNEVGDGTTSSTLISNAIFQRFYQYEKSSNVAPYEIVRGFKSIITAMQEIITDKARPCTVEDIYNICMISTNGNEEISKQISDIYAEFGMEVFIDITTSNDTYNRLKILDGLTVDEGYSDPVFINTTDGRSYIRNARVYYFADPIDTPEMVSLFDTIINNNIIDPINEEDIEEIKPTVIVAPKITSDASAIMTQLVKFLHTFDERGNAAAKPPLLIVSNIGYHSEQMNDIATLCGCKMIHKYIDPKIQAVDVAKGLAPTLENVSEFYGVCDEVEASISYTKFINPACMHEKDEDGLIKEDEEGNPVFSASYLALTNYLESELKNSIENNEDDNTVGKIRKRLQSLKANMVELQIGGITVSDRDSLRALVVDAVKNCRSAARKGVGMAANFEGYTAALSVWHNVQDDEVLEPLARIIAEAYYDIISILYKSALPLDKVEETIITSASLGTAYNIRTECYDGKVLTSIDSDIKILDAISKLVTLLLTTNQCIIQHPSLNTY